MTWTLRAVLSACAIGAASTAQAESWRAGLELIDQWSIFTCSTASLADRYWDLSVEGNQVSALGPEGARWTAHLNEGGSFKTTFSGLWKGRDFEGEVSGNAKAKWALLQNKTTMCWYRLEPTAVPDRATVQTPSEWTSVSAISRGTCLDETFARISENSASMKMTLLDRGVQFAQLDIALAADGSGRAEYRGRSGKANRIEIPPGSGKRILRFGRLDGSCHWVWEPI